MAEEPINLESIPESGPFYPPLDQKPYELWKDLLQPGNPITPAEAAKKINELFPVRKPEDTVESYNDSAAVFLEHFWGLLIRIVRLIPRDHSAQIKVVQILEELARLPPTTMEGDSWMTDETLVWTDLPFLGMCMRDDWIPPDTHGMIPNKDSALQWINQNSFAARLLHTGLMGWTNFAVWEVRRVLEEPAGDRTFMNYSVATAAEWILQSGEEVFKEMSEDIDEDEARPMAAGSLFPGKSGSLRERWSFWKTRFPEVSQQVDEDVRKQAIRAVERMKELEQAES
ncbi:hypothetical protein GJ744_004130 [Endocarpon pusillum]|uniref:Uncharacterized protein n=1 Tax=Endocarpon pusillum TaxID=364733 RepID=A0A8H7E6W5_9EURO|nr:hypothetical protein GJ744_004130 [Endocarpon pusillum]